MALSYTTFADGTGMTVSAIEAEFTKGLTYLNRGIVVGDIDANSITPDHVYMQEHYGFPKKHTEYVSADIGHHAEGLADTTRGELSNDKGKPIISTIFSQALISERFIIPGTCKRFEVMSDCEVDVTWEWMALGKYDWNLAGNPVYPDILGFFIPVYRKVNAASTLTRVSGMQRKLYAGVNALSTNLQDHRAMSHYTTHATFSPAQSGDWAVWLEYIVTSAKEHQVYVITRNMTFESRFV